MKGAPHVDGCLYPEGPCDCGVGPTDAELVEKAEKTLDDLDTKSVAKDAEGSALRERERIVAFLERDGHGFQTGAFFDEAARMIRKGEHLK
jgi:hypothetical protein